MYTFVFVSKNWSEPGNTKVGAMKLLLINHQPDIVLGLYRALRRDYAIECVATGQSALAKLRQNNYDVIILDLDIDDMPGLNVCEQIRSLGIDTPILILASSTDTNSKVTLLDSGANDYLTKPFQRAELEARLRVMTRRRIQNQLYHSRLVVGDLVLDTGKLLASRSGLPIMLRRKEFALLECLMRNAGSVVTSTILSSQAWEEDEETMANTLHVHIKHLRDKIDKPYRSALIRTVHGLGYKIEVPIVSMQKAGV
jgi:DNA-binding response OmpR family regulator